MDSERATGLKLPPNSIEAEQAVLGALLSDSGRMDEVISILQETDFYRREHQLVFDAMVKVSQSNQPVDLLTVSEYLDRNDQLLNAGGLESLSDWSSRSPSSANIITYAKIIKERSVKRQLIAISSQIADNAFNSADPLPTLLNNAQTQIMNISIESEAKKVQRFSDAAKSMLTLIDDRSRQESGLIGHSTGLLDLDSLLKGLVKKNLIIIAGRPSMGKSALAMNMAELVAQAMPVLFCSLEMGTDELMMRVFSNLSNVPLSQVQLGKMRDDQWSQITHTAHKYNDLQLYIDETSGLTPAQLSTKARRLAKQVGPLGLIVVDYIQLMQGGVKSNSRDETVGSITRSLKEMAKDFDCPIIALSQLNREVERRKGNRPSMADLRESGSIEQDADVILFVYRDKVYNEETKWGDTAEIICAKHRNGPLGKVYALAELNYSRFKHTSVQDLPFEDDEPAERLSWEN